MTLAGISILVKFVQWPNADTPILVTLAGISIVVKLVQLPNAESPILVTLAGIFIFTNFIQLENVYDGILSSPVVPLKSRFTFAFFFESNARSIFFTVVSSISPTTKML